MIGNKKILSEYFENYQRTDKPVCVNFRKFFPELANADRATHLLHPYPAKLLMHIPYLFLQDETYSKPGDFVLDPFAGSGTVLLEAALAGRQPIGVDANPFARLLSKVKTRSLELKKLEPAIDDLYKRIKSTPKWALPNVVNLSYWYFPEAIKKLQCIYEAIDETEDVDIKDFFKVCFSNCAKKVSLADPRISVPVKLNADKYPLNSAIGIKTRNHFEEIKTINITELFKKIIRRNTDRMITIHGLLEHDLTAKIVSDDARRIVKKSTGSCDQSEFNGIQKNCVQLIVTSPPYPGAQKYIRASTFSLGWLGMCAPADMMDMKKKMIGREEFRLNEYQYLAETNIKEADNVLKQIFEINPKRAAIAGNYLLEMQEVFCEMFLALKAGGKLVLVVANNKIAGIKFNTVEYLIAIAKKVGFELLLAMIDDIRSRGLMTKRNKTANVITREWVLVFRKR